MRRWMSGPVNASLPFEEELNDLLVPLGLLQRIQEFLAENTGLGYLDVGEFVRDAIRRHIQQLKKDPSKSKG